MVDGSDVVIVGAAPAGHPGVFANFEKKRSNNFVIVPPLKGPDGVQTTADDRYWGSQNYMMITSACKKPDIAARWADGFYNHDVMVAETSGFEGTDWVKAGPNDKNLEGGPALRTNKFVYGKQTNNFWQNFGFNGKTAADEMEATADQNELGTNGLGTRLAKATAAYLPYLPEKPTPYGAITVPISKITESDKVKAAVKKVHNEFYAKVVVRGINVDENWDAYVAEIKSLGIDSYVENIQAEWTKKYSLLKK